MKTISIPIEHARRVTISAQGLHKQAPFGKGMQGILRMIRQTGYVQIDTISVIERAHHHVIRSRVPTYQKKQLLILQRDQRQILEHWTHALSYLPMEDFRYTLPIKRYFREHRDPWPKADPKFRKYVLERIRKEGPMKARDFESMQHRRGDGWWDWKPAKLALERLFYEGSLIVSHREGFQKVYDIPDRVLPGWIDRNEPTAPEYAKFLIRRSIRAHGFASTASMTYLRKGMAKAVREELKSMLQNAEVLPLHIRGRDISYFTFPEMVESIPRVQKRVHFLSPFDNLVIQRNRLRNIFNFDYQIECYIPKQKRKYGYFALPVLYGSAMIGRADMKADRKTRTLHVYNLVFEEGLPITDRLLMEMSQSLHAFSTFQGMDRIRLHRCHPATEKKRLSASVESFS